MPCTLPCWMLAWARRHPWQMPQRHPSLGSAAWQPCSSAAAAPRVEAWQPCTSQPTAGRRAAAAWRPKLPTSQRQRCWVWCWVTKTCRPPRPAQAPCHYPQGQGSLAGLWRVGKRRRHQGCRQTTRSCRCQRGSACCTCRHRCDTAAPLRRFLAGSSLACVDLLTPYLSSQVFTPPAGHPLPLPS